MTRRGIWLTLLALLLAAPASAELMSRAEREYNTASGLYNRGDYAAAIQQADRYQRAYPDDARQPDAWYLKGEALYRLGLYADALTAYRRLAELYPQHSLYDDALYGIAWSLQKLDQPGEAAGYWDKLRGMADSDHADEALFRLGDCALLRGDYPAAEKLYKEFLNSRMHSPLADEVRYWLAITYQKRNNIDAFLRTMQHIGDGDDTFSDEALYALGAYHAQQRQLDKAKEYYQRILTRHPESEGAGRALLAMATVAFNEGRNSEGRDRLEQLYRKIKDPLAARGGYYLGQYYERSGDTAAARRTYEEIIDRFPPTEEWRARTILALGDLLLVAREYEAARTCYRSSVSLPDWPVEKPLLSIARSYLQEGNAAEARLRFERIISGYAGTDAARQAAAALAQLDADAGNWAAVSERLLALAPARLAPEESYLLARSYYEQGRLEFAREAFALLAQDTAGDYVEPSLYWLAATRHAGREFTEAEEQYKNYLRRYPRGAFRGDVQCGLGELYLNLGKPAEARAAFALVGDTEAQVLRERARYGLARVLYDEQKYREGITGFLQFLSAWPDSRYKAEAMYYLAACYFQIGEYGKAAEYSKLVADQYRTLRVADDAFLLYGKSLYYQKKNDAAIDAFNRLIITAPRSELLAQARFYLAKANLMSGRLDAARGLCAQLLAQRPPFADQVAYLRGQILMAQGREEEALPDFLRAQNSPDRLLRVMAQAKRGQCLHNLHRYNEAVEALLASLGNGVDGVAAGRIRLLLGKCQYKLEHYPEANAALQAATGLLAGSEQADAWNWLAIVRFRMSDFAGAATAAQAYLAMPADLTENRAAALYLQGDAQYNLKLYREAIASYELLISAHSGSTLAEHARMAIAEASVKLNEYDRAMREWEQLAANGDDKLAREARLNIARRFFELGDFGAARESFARLQQLYPDHPSADVIAYYQGRLALQANQSAEAQALLAAMMDSYPRSALQADAGYYFGLAALATRDYAAAQRGFAQAVEQGAGRFDDAGRLGLAQALHCQQQYAAAREQLRPLIVAGNPDVAPQALYLTALTYEEEKNYNEAAAAADRLTQGYSGQWRDLGDAVYARALYLAERDADLLQKRTMLASRATGAAGVEVLTMLARAEARSGAAERSVEYWQQAAQLAIEPEQRAVLFYNLAQQEYKNGAFARALEHARVAAGVPAAVDEDRWYLMALASYRLDDLAGLTQAAAGYGRTYAGGKYRGELGYLAGVLYDRTGDPQAAVRVLDEQLADNPAHELKGRLLAALGRACFHAQKFARARQALEQASQMNPEGMAGQLALLRGAVAMAEEKHNEALPLLEEALRLGADNVSEVYYRLGAVQYQRRDYAASRQWLKRLDDAALTRLGVLAEGEFMRGRMAVDAGSWQEAVNCLTRALGGGSAAAAFAPDARFLRGEALAKLGRHDEAIADWEQVVDMVADQLAIKAQLAIAGDHYARRQFADARTAYAKVLLVYANREYHDDALLGMAQCDRELNDPAGAKKQLDELLRDYADGDRAPEARTMRGQLP